MLENHPPKSITPKISSGYVSDGYQDTQ